MGNFTIEVVVVGDKQYGFIDSLTHTFYGAGKFVRRLHAVVIPWSVWFIVAPQAKKLLIADNSKKKIYGISVDEAQSKGYRFKERQRTSGGELFAIDTKYWEIEDMDEDA